jgi:superfamily II DNA or RNA helicase
VRRWAVAPRVIAEALVAVPDALLTALQPGPPAPARSIAAQLSRTLSPTEHPTTPPAWLLESQRSSFRRVLAAICRYQGALLADPVGSGKTFVALAVAAELNRGATACLVPASLVPQWQNTAQRLSIPVVLCSHEHVSRGHLPSGTRGLVIVDESHHFRNPHSRRYCHLAPWLVGRTALLLTATPIVNRIGDLAHQLLLAIRDDALSLDGVDSIRALVRGRCPAPALGSVIFESSAQIGSRPERVALRSTPGKPERSAAAHAIAAVGRLGLSKRHPIAELIGGVLLRAWASSPAAFRESLLRYRRLLLHARDALASGRAVDRAELRRFTRELDDQLVWWELLPLTEAKSELELSDLDQLEALIQEFGATEVSADPKLDRLRALLADGKPSLIFTSSRATVRYLRQRLADFTMAWCTGEKAGIGATALSRRTVLGWFRNPTTSAHAPAHLIVTDVAAEGLDLQRVARVIHYDLPWTPMRLEQREGRAVRYGSQHAQVEVVQFGLAAPLERRLRISATLSRKNRLPAAAGIGPGGRRLWQWRDQLTERFRGVPGAFGTARVYSSERGVLAGFSLIRPGDPRPMSATVLWLTPDGAWTEAPEIITACLETAASGHAVVPVESAELGEYLGLLARPVRERLRAVRHQRWMAPDQVPGTRTLLMRLQLLVAQAARRRDPMRLAQLEHAIGFGARGHTAGEAALVERLAEATDAELDRLLKSLPPTEPEPTQIAARLTGLVLFGPAKNTPDSVPYPGCPSCKPPCSTWTGP